MGMVGREAQAWEERCYVVALRPPKFQSPTPMKPPKQGIRSVAQCPQSKRCASAITTADEAMRNSVLANLATLKSNFAPISLLDVTPQTFARQSLLCGDVALLSMVRVSDHLSPI